MEYNYYFRDNPKRNIKGDVISACESFKRKWRKEPTTILVNPKEYEIYNALELTLIVKEDKNVQVRFFGIQ